jgi:hypothetical protein
MLENFGSQFEAHIHDSACHGGICRSEPAYHTACPLRVAGADQGRR